MTINGLRTMLNLAWIHLNETVPSIDDIEVLVEYLVPDVFVSKLDLAEIPASKLSRFHLEDNNLLPHERLLNGVSYKRINLNDKISLQFGVMSKSTMPLVLYEKYSQNQQTKLLIVTYEDMPPTDQETLFEYLGEPIFADTYRLPYKSLFICKIGSDKIIRHEYKPATEHTGVDADTFARLFKLGWIGSRVIDPLTLKKIHSYVLRQRYTLIHAIEFDKDSLF